MSEKGLDTVRRYDTATGALIDSFVAAGSGGLNQPGGLAFGPDGHLYVASFGSNEVLRYDGSSGAFLDVFVSGVARPFGLSFGPDGRLYVGLYDADAVARYNATSGVLIDTFVAGASGGLDKPEELSFGPDGHLYVASHDSNAVLRYNGATGAFMGAFVTAGAGGLDKPSGLSFGPDGALYVSSLGTDAVLRYDGSTGAYLGSYVAAGAGGLMTPALMSFVPQHQVTVTSSNQPPVLAIPLVDQTAPEDSVFSYSFAAGSFTDSDVGDTLTYSASLASGAALPSWLNFTPSTRTFSGTPANGDVGTFTLRVAALDSTAASVHADFLLSVPNTNDAPVITSQGGGPTATVAVAENTLLVTSVQASDEDLPAQTLSYSIQGGADAARFAIHSGTGALSFLSAPDFEAANDADTDNVYEVTVAVSDGSSSDSLALSVTVLDTVDQVNAIDDSRSTARNTAITIDVLANDVFPAGGTPTLLDFNQAANGTVSQTGSALQYVPNPAYSGPDGFDYLASDLSDMLTHYWRLDGSATDLIGTADGTLVNGPAAIIGRWGGALAFDGISQHAVLPDLSYSNDFSLSFWFRMDDNVGAGYRYLFAHDSPASTDNLNIYFIEDATPTGSGINNVLRTRLRDSNDADNLAGLDVPVAGLADGQWHQYTLTVAAGTGSAVYIDGSWRAGISNGGDAFNPSGDIFLGADIALSSLRFFKGGLDGIALRDKALTATEVSLNFVDALASTDRASVVLTVSSLNTAPAIVSHGGGATAVVSLAEGASVVSTVQATDDEMDPIVFGISGGVDAARFSIDAVTGVLTFVAAPDFEAPSDADADNVYVVEVRASDGILDDTQTLTVAVTDIDGNNLVVDTLLDTLDGDTSSTEALLSNKGADGFISLREALTASNNTAGLQTIQLGAGTHLITRAGAGEDLNASDDFDISDSVIITGAGADQTTISGGGAFKIIEIKQGTVQISGLTIADGRSTAKGAGLEVDAGATLLLSQAVVRDHVGLGADAAGIENAGHLSLIDVEVRDNTAGLDGGGLRHVGTQLHLERVTFANNSAGSAGGGVYINGTGVTILNTTFSSNSAALAGGGLFSATPVTLTNVTFAHNSNPLSGGGAIASSSNVSIRNTLFTGSVGGVFGGSGQLLSLGHNLSSGAVAQLVGPGDRPNFIADLGPLADNGGPTRTHALGNNSQAINAGTSTGAPATDQRGMGRAGSVDIGAYEVSTAVNLAPFHVLPAALSAVEDQDLAVSSVSVFDPNETDSVPSWRIASTSVTVTQGNLTLVPAGGAVISSGANGTASLTLQGSEADINASLASLSYRALPHVHGADTLTITTVDGEGVIRQDTSTISVGAVNDPPEGTSSSLTLDADLRAVLTRASFGFSDHTAAAENHSFQSVWLQLPTRGSLLLNGTVLTAATEVSVADLDAQALVYQAAASASGSAYASLAFQVRDGGGTALGGADLAPTPASLSFDVPNRAPTFTSPGSAALVSLAQLENTALVANLVAVDADGPVPPLLFSIAGGADAALFEVDMQSGVLRWRVAPDFESPADSNADGTYELSVQVSDGLLSNTQNLQVQVLNVDEAPTIVRNRLVVTEGAWAAPDVLALDVDTATPALQWQVQALSGGRFESTQAPGVAITVFTQAEINAGLVLFVTDGDEAAPAYELVLSDGANSLMPQRPTIAFSSVNDAPTLSTVSLGAIDEDGSFLLNASALLAAASDPDSSALVINGLRVQSGNAALQDLGGGQWRVQPAAHWSGNVSLQFEVSDGQALAVGVASLTVTAVNDAPSFTNPGGAAQASLVLAENTPIVTTLGATDIDGDTSTLRFAIAGGADAALFAVDAVTGELRFLTAANHEAPHDTDRDGRYELVVQVSDGQASDAKALSVQVSDVDEAPVLQSQALWVTGQTATLVLQAADPEGLAPGLQYEVLSTQGGQFEWLATPGQAVLRFTQADVDAGRVRFALDNSSRAPDFRLALSDGLNRAALPRPEVSVAVVLASPETLLVEPQAAPAPAAAPAEQAKSDEPEAATAPAAAQPPPELADPRAPLLSDLASSTAQALASPPSGLNSGPALAAAYGQAGVGKVSTPTEASIPALGFWNQGIAAMDMLGEDSLQQRPQWSSEWLQDRSGKGLAQAMDDARLDENAMAAQGFMHTEVGTVALISSGLSVGYVLWLVRGGVLLASLMSSVPAWASVDPLPVLAQARRRGPAGESDDNGDPQAEDSGFDPVDRLFSRARASARRASKEPDSPVRDLQKQRSPEEALS